MGKDQELIEAARSGNYPVCEKILSAKPKKAGPFASLRRPNAGINSRDSSGYTALHYASLNGHKHIVELLLSYEASCNSADDKGSSPLHLASWAGFIEIVVLLLTHGPSIANVNLTNSDQETSLHCASQHGHVGVVRILLEHGADPNIKNSKDETALDLASLYGRIETVDTLLSSHPELISHFTAYGGTIYSHTPLHLASRNGHREVVGMILNAGFDVNVRTNRGTALTEAAVCGKVDVVKCLLRADINLELRDHHDKSVLEIMDELKTPVSKEIIHIILEHMGLTRRAPPGTLPIHASQQLTLVPDRGTSIAGSPYDNVSITQSLESYSMDLDLSATSSTTQSHPHWMGTLGGVSAMSVDAAILPSSQLRPKGAKSVEDMVDRRISALSSTSGYSDCTSATLQGARSIGSSLFSGDETITPQVLLNTDDETDDRTSISSAESVSSAPTTTEKKNTTLTRDTDATKAIVSANAMQKVPPPTAPKPILPAKPALLRAGLKPVKIPKVDSKLSKPSTGAVPPPLPQKPPRKSVASSPTSSARDSWSSEKGVESCQEAEDSSAGELSFVSKHHQGSSSYYSGSKSFDELDDILCERDRPVRKSSSRRKNRARAQSSALGIQGGLAQGQGVKDYCHYHRKCAEQEEIELRNKTEGDSRTLPVSRHSCDELMTRSFHGTEPGGGGGDEASDSSSHVSSSECQRCLLNKMTNRTLSLDCDEVWLSAQQHRGRFISQRQYKRKIKREAPSYVTLERKRSGDKKTRRRGPTSELPLLEAESASTNPNPPPQASKQQPQASEEMKMTMVSKTTFKLRSWEGSELNPIDPNDLDLELMEIPLSPTHFEQPGTPDHEPPSPFEAEREIQRVLDQIRVEAKRMKHCKSTSMDDCYLRPLDSNGTWPTICSDLSVDQFTQTEQRSPPSGSYNSKAQGGVSSLHSNEAIQTQGMPDNGVEIRSKPIIQGQAQLAVELNQHRQSGTTHNCHDLNQGLPSSSEAMELETTRDESQPEVDKSGLSIFSPFDEKEEWKKISLIIDQFGSDIGQDIKESTTPQNSPNVELPTEKRKEGQSGLGRTRLGGPIVAVSSSLSDWLRVNGLEKFEKNFMDHGFDHLDFIGPDLIRAEELKAMGIKDQGDIMRIERAIQKNRLMEHSDILSNWTNFEDWLCRLSLEIYVSNFETNFFTSKERIQSIWDDELTSILEIEKIGHRRRILLSVAGTSKLSERNFTKVPNVDQPEEMDISDSNGQVNLNPMSSSTSEVSVNPAKSLSSKEMDLSQGPVPKAKTERNPIPPPTPPKPRLGAAVSSPTHQGSGNGNGNTLGRGTSRKKKSAPLPPTNLAGKDEGVMEQSKERVKRNKSSGNLLEEKGYLTYKVKYFGKKVVKDFKGIDSTKSAIDTSKKAKPGSSHGPRTRFIILSEKWIKILKRDGKELVAKHDVSSICCVVQDATDPSYFGYITTDGNNGTGEGGTKYSHVFATGCKGKTFEILMVVCEGFTNAVAKTKSFHQDALTSATSPSSPTSGSISVSSRFRSDQIVSRMKLFFQGSSGQQTSQQQGLTRRDKSPSRKDGARRKRGGSVDNLLDDLDEPLSKESKKKSLSSKNLSMDGQLEEVKITSV